MDNKFIFNYDKFKQILVKYNGQKIYYGDFENVLIDTLEKMNYSKQKKQVLISLQQEFTAIFVIIYSVIEEYLKNISCLDNNILNNVKYGDKVVKGGELLIFDKFDNQYIHMIGKDNCKVMIPIEKAYLLTKYTGTANRINKANKHINIAKEFLSHLMDIKKEELLGDIVKSVLIVVESKEKLFNFINSIEIIFNGDKYKLPEIFPFAYYSSEENYEYFKGNKIKQNALIKFVSSTYTALDLIREDENINNIIFIGNNTYKNSLNLEVRQIEMYDSVEKIMFIDSWESNFDFTIFDDEFSIYAFTKNVILDNVNLYSEKTENYMSDLQKYNNTLLLNLANKEISIYQINNAEKFDKCIYRICINLKSLFDFSYDNIQVLDFCKISYSLCNKLEQTVVQLKRSSDNEHKINEQIENLNKIKNVFSENRSEHIIMNEIINEFIDAIKLIYIDNYKNEFIMQRYSRKKPYTLFVKNKTEFEAVKLYYKQYPSYKFSVRLLKKKLKDIYYENVIMPFYLDSKNINFLKSNKILSLDLLVYNREKSRVDSLIYKTLEEIRYVEDNNQLSKVKEEIAIPIINKHYLNKSNKKLAEDNLEFTDNEHKVNKLIEENLLDIYLSRNKNKSNDYVRNINIKKVVLFKDGNYAFLTANYKANVLDKYNSNIESKELIKLQPEDNIIFTLNRVNEEEDIVKIILKKLLQIEQFKNKYGQYFKLNKLWKDELKKYMKTNDLTEENISAEFRMNSRIVNKVTIANWLNGNIVGPRNPDDIRIAIKIINKENLLKEEDKIVEACQYERKIQVHVRKALAKIIVNSVTSEDKEESEIQKLIKDTVDDISRYAYIGTIESIKDVTESMNIQYVNRVIEKEV